MNDSILKINDLTIDYLTANGPFRAVDKVSLEIERGEIFGLVGESGSGKSTLVHGFLRSLGPPAVITGGSVWLDGRDVLEMNSEEIRRLRWSSVSMVMQSAMNALNPVLKVSEQISDVLFNQGDITMSMAESRSKELFDLVGIDHSRLSSYPHELSGGMRQRVVLAIALALMPPLIVMDEPTTALDVIVEREIIWKILNLQDKLNFSVLFITHDLNLILEFADRVGIMRNGKILETGPVDQIRSDSKNDYIQNFLGSIPSASGVRRNDLLPEYIPDNSPKDKLLNVVNLSRHFSSGGWIKQNLLKAVQDVSFTVSTSEIVALVGESGSGKSTIAQLISRLIPPTSGTIIFDDQVISDLPFHRTPLELRRKVQMVFQNPYASLNDVHTVFYQLSRPLLKHGLAENNGIREKVLSLLEIVGLSPGEKFIDKYPHEMSGGERQRTAIARALAVRPKLIVADEPTSMLDISIRMDILRLFANLRKEHGIAILFITHDIASARYLADRIIVLNNGMQVDNGQSEDLIKNPQHEYTRNLIEAASPGWLAAKNNTDN